MYLCINANIDQDPSHRVTVKVRWHLIRLIITYLKLTGTSGTWSSSGFWTGGVENYNTGEFFCSHCLTRIRIRMDPHWFVSLDPDSNPHCGKKQDPGPIPR